jgi:hypothetical protein
MFEYLLGSLPGYHRSIGELKNSSFLLPVPILHCHPTLNHSNWREVTPHQGGGLKIKAVLRPGVMAHTYSPNYAGGRDWEDHMV